MVFGVVLGVLSVRYDHKKLLFLGVLGVTLGTLGCFLAPSFFLMQIFYPLEGIGTIIVSAMTFTLVGKFLILNKRPKVTGWILAGGPLAVISGSLVTSLFFQTGNWRSFLLWFALPISLIALTAVYLGVPSSPQKPKIVGREAYLKSFKQVILNKSSFGCLLGNLVRQAGLAWAIIFSVTFFREQFDLSPAFGALIALSASGLGILAYLIGGHLVNRIGRKLQVVITLVVSSPILALLPFIPNLWIAFVLFYVQAFIHGLSSPATVSLALEQAPESRGTMMSIGSIFVTLGIGFGATMGGATLVVFRNYASLPFVFAAVGLIAAAIYFFLTKDTCYS